MKTNITAPTTISGTDHSLRVNVNLDVFETTEDANRFARSLHSVLVARYGYTGSVRVTNQYSEFSEGDEIAGGLPSEWNREDYEAVCKEAAN